MHGYGVSVERVVLHSDRGSQYTSEAYRKLLKSCGIIQSLSGTGHCYDNARMESFFATLKKEKLYQILNHSQVSRHKKAQFFRGSGYFVCSQYKASASLGVSILSVPCGLFEL